ncbi:telomeric repeat-binding factor 2-interacting protein 1 isoform X2 [Antennarius striatus]|uniref:telomeric repeat-binding factor 2-interacting protein 1 isoform X2 n=1 Tax=Antennarius striatus TaxID=241820 RepID=UPI0035B29EE4
MPTKQQTANISPVLFMKVDGEPMSFFLRPGPAKCKLQPLITAGGGALCNVQQPWAILLVEPGEKGSVTESTTHWFVSTQYIYDCIEKDEQLDLEDYRLKPEGDQRHSTRHNNVKAESSRLKGGRLAYTTEDDAAILSYVSKRSSDIGGNRLWQEMEKKRVTGHSWQSMKYHYRVQLAKTQTEAVAGATAEEEATTAGGENKVEDQEMEGDRPPTVEGGCLPTTHSKDDLTQIDAQSIPAESMQQEVAETQTSICPQGEVEPVNPQTAERLAEGTQVSTADAETNNSPQPGGPCLNPLTDLHPILAEHRELETDKPQTIVCLQKESGPEDLATPQPTPPPKTPPYKKPKEKRKASPVPEQPQLRRTQRQLQLETASSPEPYRKKLRLSTRSVTQLSSPPESSIKTKSANKKSVLQQEKAVDQPPSHKASGESVAAGGEGPQEERGPSPISGKTESVLVPQKEEIKKQKRKRGILEMATDEFESENEDELLDLQSSDETATEVPTEKECRPPSPDAPTSMESSPEPGPGLQQQGQDPQAFSSTCLPTSDQDPAAAESVDPHLFIFQNESQEEDSTNRQPAVNKEPAFSLTQVQLEEGKQCLRELMKETNKNLDTVTKALLTTSGDLSEALDLLLNPASVSGLFWHCCDDDLLLSNDPGVRQQLRDKYSEELVAKRIVFLELEG